MYTKIFDLSLKNSSVLGNIWSNKSKVKIIVHRYNPKVTIVTGIS